jgi:hypothetical protein
MVTMAGSLELCVREIADGGGFTLPQTPAIMIEMAGEPAGRIPRG